MIKLDKKKFKEHTKLIVSIEMDHHVPKHNMTRLPSKLWPMVF